MTEPTATEFTPVYTWFAGNGGYYAKDVSQTTSTAVFYEMRTRGSTGSDTTPAWMVGQYGIEFRYENGNTVLYCNTGDNTDIPYTWANGAVTQTLTSNNIGDTITATLNGGTAYTFTVTAGMLWTASTGTGGLGGGTVYIQDAKIVNYFGLTGHRFEQRGYPVASYELTGTGFTDSWTLTSQSNDLQHHISNLSVGTYYLYQDSVLVATLLARSKVSCNFW